MGIISKLIDHIRGLACSFFGAKISFFLMLSGLYGRSSVRGGDDFSKKILSSCEIIGFTFVLSLIPTKYFRIMSFRKSWLSRLLFRRLCFKIWSPRTLCASSLSSNLSAAASTDGKWVIDLNRMFWNNGEQLKIVWECLLLYDLRRVWVLWPWMGSSGLVESTYNLSTFAFFPLLLVRLMYLMS